MSDPIDHMDADQLRQAVLQAAGEWWSGFKPEAFTLQQHLDNPTVNVTCAHHDSLALAVAGAVQRGLIKLPS